jgi:hypothetical protein
MIGHQPTEGNGHGTVLPPLGGNPALPCRGRAMMIGPAAAAPASP